MATENNSSDPDAPFPEDERPRVLREELSELADVVGPIQLVDLLIERAFQLNATDIHLDPVMEGLRVRLRVDGQLHDILHLPETLRHNIISRVKLLAELDLTERRHCQDGHIPRRSLRGDRDVRVGTSPTIHGERIVLRLMPDHSRFNDLDELGIDADQLVQLRRELSHPYGMIIVAGPVGSGKSTTLYGALQELNDPNVSVTTIEDPVERRIPGVNQIQVEPKIGFGFANALRGVLRQDPNVLMVGEIRDSETAHIACRAGLTGVLVLTTIHAHDSAAAIDVLRDYGIPPMFIADSVRCVVAQRLVRKICTESRESYEPDDSTCEILGIPPEEASNHRLERGVPSPANFHTGYAGRTGIFEVLSVDRTIRQAILRGESQSQISERAVEDGMQTLWASARRKVLDGVTTADEMYRTVLMG